MIIGELDLDRAERDPAYLARIKAFLDFAGGRCPGRPPGAAGTAPAAAAPAPAQGGHGPMDGAGPQLALN